MKSKTKKVIRDILFSSYSTKEGKRKLAEFSGRTTSHISELIRNYKIGRANMIGVIIAEYKLELIKQSTQDKSIHDIIERDLQSYTDDELALSSGLNKSVINNLRRYHTEKEGSFGFKYHVLMLKIEQIAKLVE